MGTSILFRILFILIRVFNYLSYLYNFQLKLTSLSIHIVITDLANNFKIIVSFIFLSDHLRHIDIEIFLVTQAFSEILARSCRNGNFRDY